MDDVEDRGRFVDDDPPPPPPRRTNHGNGNGNSHYARRIMVIAVVTAFAAVLAIIVSVWLRKVSPEPLSPMHLVTFALLVLGAIVAASMIVRRRNPIIIVPLAAFLTLVFLIGASYYWKQNKQEFRYAANLLSTKIRRTVPDTQFVMEWRRRRALDYANRALAKSPAPTTSTAPPATSTPQPVIITPSVQVVPVPTPSQPQVSNTVVETLARANENLTIELTKKSKEIDDLRSKLAARSTPRPVIRKPTGAPAKTKTQIVARRTNTTTAVKRVIAEKELPPHIAARLKR